MTTTEIKLNEEYKRNQPNEVKIGELNLYSQLVTLGWLVTGRFEQKQFDKAKNNLEEQNRIDECGLPLTSLF